VQEKPLRMITPRAVPAGFYIFGSLVAGFASLFPAVFVFVVSNLIVESLGQKHSQPVFGYAVAAYVVGFLIVLTLMAVKMLQEPATITYSIFPDRIEYEGGLLTRTARTQRFDHVLDVVLSEGVLQQTQGVGTIRIVTRPVMAQNGGTMVTRQIDLTNVPDPRENYEFIRAIALKNAEG
jgi:uncharacterized membrane protein YdbT with pleckstrin-like domain